MAIFEIHPLKRVGPVQLGASRGVARHAMLTSGFPLERSYGGVDYFCASCMRLSYGPNDEVWFIGISGSPQITFRIKKYDAFGISAQALFNYITTLDNSGHHDFDEYDYFFPNKIITLWDADEQYDIQGTGAQRVWGQIGIGNHDYAKVIANITKAFNN